MYLELQRFLSLVKNEVSTLWLAISLFSHLNYIEIDGTKRFIPKGFELSYPIWSIVYFPAKHGLKIGIFIV